MNDEAGAVADREWREREKERMSGQSRGAPIDTEVDAHPFKRRGWRFWICDRCYAPRSLHPRPGYRRARPLGDNRYLSADAPHFKEGW
jgi:hypothetical protein